MTLPVEFEVDSYAKSIMLVERALEARLTNATQRLVATPSFHTGMPDAMALPDEKVAVWLDWTNFLRDDENSTFDSCVYISRWAISIVAQDEKGDPFGCKSELGLRMWSACLTTLTETRDDLGLDGACEYFLDPETEKATGRLGGDRNVQAYEIVVDVHHTFQIRRC